MEFTYSTRNPDIPTGYARLEAMHTVCEVLLPRMDERLAKDTAERIERIIREGEACFSRFVKGSPLWELNRKGAAGPVQVCDDLFFALELCDTFRNLTDGYFDPSATLSTRTGERKWTMDPSDHSVAFSREGIALDLGGFAKGFVLERSRKMVSERTSCAIISLGGSSTAVIGTHPLGAPWPVGVAHTYYTMRNAHTFELEDCTMSISGKDPHGRSHIIDPKTGLPVLSDGMVVVTGPSAIITEILSTAMWAAPKDVRQDILRHIDGSYGSYKAWEVIPLPDGRTITDNICQTSTK